MTREDVLAALCPPLVKRRLSGDERFRCGDDTLPFTVREFWAWSSSDLMSNAFRGRVAEFLVAQALGVAEGVRDEWDPWDLTSKRGPTVEVKSSAYVQAWAQRLPSAPVFDIAPKRFWNAATNTMDADAKRHAAVYVFALLAHLDRQTVEPLDVRQWEFYVLPTRVLDTRFPSQKSIRLPALRNAGAKNCPFEGLVLAVEEASIVTEPSLDALLAFVSADGRVCPVPDHWHRLWEMLPGRKPDGNNGWDPPVPLILGGWCAPEAAKCERLAEHLRYAASHGVLDDVDRYLRRLPEDAWHRAHTTVR